MNFLKKVHQFKDSINWVTVFDEYSNIFYWILDIQIWILKCFSVVRAFPGCQLRTKTCYYMYILFKLCWVAYLHGCILVWCMLILLNPFILSLIAHSQTYCIICSIDFPRFVDDARIIRSIAYFFSLNYLV